MTQIEELFERYRKIVYYYLSLDNKLSVGFLTDVAEYETFHSLVLADGLYFYGFIPQGEASFPLYTERKPDVIRKRDDKKLPQTVDQKEKTCFKMFDNIRKAYRRAIHFVGDGVKYDKIVLTNEMAYCRDNHLTAASSNYSRMMSVDPLCVYTLDKWASAINNWCDGNLVEHDDDAKLALKVFLSFMFFDVEKFS